MKIYLDTCCLQRPLDDQRQARIRLEAEAVLALLEHVESGRISLFDSEILHYEINRASSTQRQQHALNMLALSQHKVLLGDAIKQLARRIEREGIKPLDAAHLATAEIAGADYFCTCDDRFLKKAGSLEYLHVQAMSPVQLLMEFES
jgi:predicted nucleic acid-binding protein